MMQKYKQQVLKAIAGLVLALLLGLIIYAFYMVSKHEFNKALLVFMVTTLLTFPSLLCVKGIYDDSIKTTITPPNK
jgi:ABC-type arginine transport system permease subunit